MTSPPGWSGPGWDKVAQGIFCKLLADDAERQRVSMLVRLLPNVEYPAHTHADLEELHLLRGELWIDERKLGPGDFSRAQATTNDRRVWSETGCTCFITTSTRDILQSTIPARECAKIALVNAHEHEQTQDSVDVSPGTLGEVLYRKRGNRLVSEKEWVDLVRAVAAGDQAALHGLYERAHRLVFTLAVRICGGRETAEEVTLDVFLDLWRRAGGYDPANGTVLGWIMNQARSRALDRLRFEKRKKRVDPGAEDPTEIDEAANPLVLLELKQRGDAVRAALTMLTPQERQAIEVAFFAGLTHVEAAERLNEPLGTVKTRIRSGLQKLRQAMAEGGERP